MFEQTLSITLILTTVATGLVAGVFLSFSDFIMRALRASSEQSGAEAMQQINQQVYRSTFMVLLLGLVPFSLALGVIGAIYVPGTSGIFLISGALFYVLGVFLTTVVCNVPMNKKLDAMALQDVATPVYWRDYAQRWTQWNHVRSATAAMATLAYLGAALTLAP